MKSICLNLLICSTLLLFCSCSSDSGSPLVRGPEPENGETPFPPNAQNIKILGKGWATFELDGHKFLFRRTRYDRSASDCITVLPEHNERISL